MSEPAYVTEETLKSILNEALVPVFGLLGEHDKKLDKIPDILLRLDRIEERLDGHDRRFDRIEERLDGHDRRFDVIEAGVAAILDHLRNGESP